MRHGLHEAVGPCSNWAVDIDESSLEFAKKNGWAVTASNPKKVDVAEELRKMTDGRGGRCDHRGPTASSQLLKGAISGVRPGGTVSIIGVFETPQEVEMNKLWIKNISIRMGLVSANRIPELITLIKEGKLNMRPLITHTLPLPQVAEGYDIFEERRDGALRVVLKAGT